MMTMVFLAVAKAVMAPWSQQQPFPTKMTYQQTRAVLMEAQTHDLRLLVLQ
jgi:hypothetical protein